MNAIAGWALGIGALLLGGLWMPALAIAVVAAVFSAAKPEATPEDHAPTESEEVATLDVRAWEEPLPAPDAIDAKRPLGPEKMRVHDFLIGECSVHDCPDCGEGLVSIRVYDGREVRRCDKCNTR